MDAREDEERASLSLCSLAAHTLCHGVQVLTPYQALSIAANARPYYADLAQIVGWIVEGGKGTAVATEGIALAET